MRLNTPFFHIYFLATQGNSREFKVIQEKSRELKVAHGNSSEPRGTQGKPRKLKETQGNSRELKELKGTQGNLGFFKGSAHRCNGRKKRYLDVYVITPEFQKNVRFVLKVVILALKVKKWPCQVSLIVDLNTVEKLGIELSFSSSLDTL